MGECVDWLVGLIYGSFALWR